MDKSFKAASYEEPSLQKFNPYTLPSDNELQYFDRYTIISRCRDLALNTPIGKAIIDVFVSHIIGGGLRPNVLGEKWVEDEFITWCENHEFGGYTSFDQLQELVVRTVLLSGDILVNTIVKEDDSFNVQLIEPERVCNPGMGTNTLTLRNGVEIDQEGSPIKYHILSNHPAEPTGYTYFVLDAKDTDGNKKSWLVYQPYRPDQHRGIPLFSAVVDKFKMLDKYFDAELLASVIASNFCVFVESPSDVNPLGTESTQTYSSGQTANTVQLRPGMIVRMPPGEKIQIANPTRPNSNFEQFINAVTKQICAGVGLSYEVVQMAFNANYSASKAAMAQSWKTIMYYRRMLIKYFCNPIFKLWCNYMDIKPPKVDWVGPSKVILDDSKEIQAATDRVNLGISSRQEECEELRGKDWWVTNQNLAVEKELGYGDRIEVEQPVVDTWEPEPGMLSEDQAVSVGLQG